MAEFDICLNEGIFGSRTIATIRENGDIWVPEGFDGRIIGAYKDGAVYKRDGFFYESRILDSDISGSYYKTEDAGLFSHGSFVGRIMPDGTIRDSKGCSIGHVVKRETLADRRIKEEASKPNGESATETGNNKHKGGGGGEPGAPLGTLFCVLGVGFLVCLSASAYWGNFNFGGYSPGAVAFFALAIACPFIVSVYIIAKEHMKGLDVGVAILPCYIGGMILFGVGCLVESCFTGSLNVLSVLEVVIGVPLITVGASGPVALVEFIIAGLVTNLVFKE